MNVFFFVVQEIQLQWLYQALGPKIYTLLWLPLPATQTFKAKPCWKSLEAILKDQV